VTDLPPRKTLNGKFDAYCHVCWQAIYGLWIDDVDPAGACIEGASKISDCRQASSWERTKGEMLKYLRENST
jgi:hypothetical protein